MKLLHQKILSCSILFLFSLTLSAQNPGIDSLKRILPGLKEDTNRANTLNILSRSLWFVGQFEDSKTYAKEALSLSEKLDFKKGRGAAYHNLGKINTYQNNLTEAFICFNTSLKLMQEAKDIQGICRAYFGLGDCYAVQQNYPEALNNYYTILKINGDKQVSAAALERTASINQYYIGNDSLALKDYLTSAKIYEELGDKIDMGNCYNQMSNLFRNQGKNDAALELAFKAIRLYEEMGASAAAAYTHIAVADIYLSQGKLAAIEGKGGLAQQKFKDASKIFDSTIKKVEESGVKNSIAFAYRSMGNTFLELGELKKAKKMLQKSLHFSILAQNYSHIQSAYYSLSVIDTIVGDYKQAYRDYAMSMFYYDSLSNKDASKKLVQMQMTNEFDKKQEILKVEQLKKDEDAKRQRNLQYMTIAGLGILVLVVFLIASIQWKNNKERKRSNILLQQQKEKVENTLSELKTTQAQLIQSEKMASLGQLTAGIAHEIQNPLNFVNNFSEVNKELLAEMNTELQKGNFEDAKVIAGDVLENEKRINQHGKRADAIVKGMLQHSRANSGKKELTDLNALSDEYLRLSYHGFRANNKSFNASLQTDFDDSIGKMNIIPEEIGRVLLNLYNNAFYSVSEKKKQADDDFVPTVSVTTKSTGSKVELRVKDNGIGIPKIVLDKIFQPFFTSKPTGQGTGLGLSLAYDIVKAHGGELTVESMEGEGAEFIVRLPK